MIRRAPELLTLTVDGNMAPRVLYMADTLGMGPLGAKKVLGSCPSLFGVSERNLGTKFHYFSETLGLGCEGAIRSILMFPDVLSYSLEYNVIPTVGRCCLNPVFAHTE